MKSLAPEMGTVAAELAKTLEDLVGAPPMIDDEGNPPLVGVWVGDELIGAGECVSEALADAIRAARSWGG